MARLRVGVLVSGFGSNLQTLIDLCADPEFPAEIVAVISNKPNVVALERAAKAGIRTSVIPHKSFPDRLTFDQAIDSALRAADVQLVCLAGFMRILTPMFVELWRDAVINIHPSLLPSFRGLDTHRQALEAEHQAYPLALRLIAERRVTVEGRRVRISGGTGPVAAALINPAS